MIWCGVALARRVLTSVHSSETTVATAGVTSLCSLVVPPSDQVCGNLTYLANLSQERANGVVLWIVTRPGCKGRIMSRHSVSVRGALGDGDRRFPSGMHSEEAFQRWP